MTWISQNKSEVHATRLTAKSQKLIISRRANGLLLIGSKWKAIKRNNLIWVCTLSLWVYHRTLPPLLIQTQWPKKKSNQKDNQTVKTWSFLCCTEDNIPKLSSIFITFYDLIEEFLGKRTHCHWLRIPLDRLLEWIYLPYAYLFIHFFLIYVFNVQLYSLA